MKVWSLMALEGMLGFSQRIDDVAEDGNKDRDIANAGDGDPTK